MSRLFTKKNLYRTFLSLILLLPSVFYSQSRITSFYALALKDSVRLSFSITPGQSCTGYYIMKGSDSMNLSPVFIYPGLCGNSNYPEAHTYFDETPNKVFPNYYQIHIPPGDYSKIIRVDMAAAFENMIIFPQPAETQVNIAINNKKNYNYELNIFDRFGTRRGFASGYCSTSITLNTDNFPLGLYIFYIIDQDGNAYRGKFVKN